MPEYGGHLEFDDVAMLVFFGTFDMLFRDTLEIDPENSTCYYEIDLMLLD